MTIKNLIISLLFLSSCSYISGPEGYFPSKQYDFIEEKIEEPLKLPDDRSLASLEDHYPVADYQDTSLEIVNHQAFLVEQSYFLQMKILALV